MTNNNSIGHSQKNNLDFSIIFLKFFNIQESMLSRSLLKIDIEFTMEGKRKDLSLHEKWTF